MTVRIVLIVKIFQGILNDINEHNGLNVLNLFNKD